MMKPAILIYGVSDVSVEAIAKASHNLGYQSIFLYSRADYYDGDILFNIMRHFSIEYVDQEDIDKIIERLLSMYRICGVISSKDEFIGPSVNVARKYGFKSISANSVLANSKDYIASKFSHLGPQTLDASTASKESIEIFRNKFDRIVIKPKHGTDSVGVTILKKGQEMPFLSDDYILQEYIEGRNILIDGAVLDGKIVDWGVSEVGRKLGNTETRYDMPVWDIMGTDCYQMMREGVAEICKELEIRKSFFHVQYILGSDGSPKIIDPNFGRVGGSGFSLLISAALQIKHEEFWEGYIKLVAEDVLDKRFFNELHPLPRSVINFGLEKDGLLVALDRPEDDRFFYYGLKRLPSQLCSLYNSNAGWIGAIMGPTHSVDEYAAKIRALTSNGMVPIIY